MADTIVLQEAKNLMTRFINEYREGIFEGYCTFDDKQWDCNSTSISNIMGANVLSLLNGGNLPPDFTWRDYNNNDWPVTATYMGQLAQTIGIFYNGCYQASWQHKAVINELTSVDEVMNYDYSHLLWPDPNK